MPVPPTEQVAALMSGSKGGGIQSLERADAILSVICDQGPGGAALKTIAEAAGLNRATTHHILATLKALGYVEQDRTTHRYALGRRNLELTWSSGYPRRMAAQFHNLLMRICMRSALTVNFAVPYIDTALIVESLEGPQVVRNTPYTGTRSDYHSSAVGKAILAHLPVREMREILSSPKKAHTSFTLVDTSRLQAHLVAISRTAAYAMERQENEIGAACVAHPVFDGSGSLLGAISVAGSSEDFTGRRSRKLAAIIAQEARLEGLRVSRG